MIKTDKRLKAILNEIEGDVLADIGCDHGKVVASAVLQNKVNKGIAVDISRDSLQKALILAKELNIDKRIEFIEGNGLEPLKAAPDCIVIAGLGGNEIINILTKKLIDAKYILVAHQDCAILRKYLMKNGFYVHKDYVITQGKRYYDIIVATKGKSNYKESELYTGKNIPATNDYLDKLTCRRNRLKKIISNSNDFETLSIELKAEWEEINNVLQNKRHN